MPHTTRFLPDPISYDSPPAQNDIIRSTERMRSSARTVDTSIGLIPEHPRAGIISHVQTCASLFPFGGTAKYDGVTMTKLLSREDLLSKLSIERAEGKRIVFTNGCFDLMHIGHTRYLQAAKALGDILVVGVNSDASVRTLDKAPDRPIVPGAQRAEVLAALGCVDFVVMFDESDPLQLITAVQPDVLVKGGDWAIDRIVGRDFVEARGGVVKTIPLVPGLSTTGLLQRIRSTAK